MKLQDLLEARTISFADPDREPGAVEREGNARDALAKREKAAQSAWEDLIAELGGHITLHHKPGERNPYGGSSAALYATLPKGFKIDMWRSDILLVSPKDLPNEDRKAIQMIWKKHGLNLYGTDLVYLGSGDANKYFNSVVIGYYSSLQGDEEEARTKAIIATYDYMNDLVNLNESKQESFEHPFSVKVLHKGKGKWPKLNGEIYEHDVLIGTFERGAVVDGYVPPITYKFRTERAKARFDDFADSNSIAETIEALLPKSAV